MEAGRSKKQALFQITFDNGQLFTRNLPSSLKLASSLQQLNDCFELPQRVMEIEVGYIRIILFATLTFELQFELHTVFFIVRASNAKKYVLSEKLRSGEHIRLTFVEAQRASSSDRTWSSPKQCRLRTQVQISDTSKHHIKNEK